MPEYYKQWLQHSHICYRRESVSKVRNADLRSHLRFIHFQFISTEEKSYLDVFKSPGPVKSLLTKPNSTIALLPLFESNEKFTHTVWVKKFAILLLQQFGDEHLSAVASLQVFMLPLAILFTQQIN